MSLKDEQHQHHSPIGDVIETFCGPRLELCGYVRALHRWENAQLHFPGLELTAPKASGPQLNSAQVHSMRLLQEWWEATTQQKCLTATAVRAIRTAARNDEAAGSVWCGRASRADALLSESTYHTHMFLLFEFEFVVEARDPLNGDRQALSDFLQHLRTKCSRLAALQRIAHAAIEQDSIPQPQRIDPQLPSKSLLQTLRRVIPVCVQPCPWLSGATGVSNLERPHFIWDVENRRTLVTSQLPHSFEYICISHTWGRWLKVGEPKLRVPGVDWLIPQNSKFEVASLPDQLQLAFHTGYVWFDLLCIPQDGSLLGSIEISRQALIFQNATAVVGWLNDVQEWCVMPDIIRWFGLFYLHTNVNLLEGEAAFPNMPQPEEADYKAMELYDWTTGGVSSILVKDGKPTDKSLKLAAPMPWFTSLWTLQEACFRPDLIFCDKDWRPLALRDTMVTLDTLVTLDTFVTQNEFARSVTRPRTNQESGLVLPSFDFPEVEKPNGCRDLTLLLVDTHISEIMTVNAAAILTFGQFRQCTSRRGEAIMAVVGSTEWYLNHIGQFGKPPSESDLVLDLYPLRFVQEAARKIGPTFFTSIQTELRYLENAVDLSTGFWSFRPDRSAVGSMLPFSKSPGFLRPPVAPKQKERAHPAIQGWEISGDGSVRMKQAGILHLSTEQQVEAFVHAPLYDEEDKIHLDTQLRMVDKVDLGGWLCDFANPESAPNFAVSLFQTSSVGDSASLGTHTGLLLKCCGYDVIGGRMSLVKIGLFFTNFVDIAEVPSSEVDWIVL